MKKKKLTPKQTAFVREYLIDLNATEAAKKAGYSQKTSYSQGQRLLKDVEIQQALQKAMQARAAEAERTAVDVFKDIITVTKEAMDDGDRRSALKGLELQGKHLGMFTEKVDHTSSDGTMSPAKMIDLGEKTIDEIAKLAKKVFIK